MHRTANGKITAEQANVRLHVYRIDIPWSECATDLRKTQMYECRSRRRILKHIKKRLLWH